MTPISFNDGLVANNNLILEFFTPSRMLSGM